MKLLEIQSSVRHENSISRQLSQVFIEAWQVNHSQVEHTLRDVGMNPPSLPTELWTKANYTPPQERTESMKQILAGSEELITELRSPDRIVLGVPMYNFSVPSNFKAYIDNIVRVDRTFTFDPETFTFTGLVTKPKCLLISPRAIQYESDSAMAAMNFCEAYIEAIFRFLGVEEFTTVVVPDQYMPEDIRQQAIEKARRQLLTIAKTW